MTKRLINSLINIIKNKIKENNNIMILKFCVTDVGTSNTTLYTVT